MKTRLFIVLVGCNMVAAYEKLYDAIMFVDKDRKHHNNYWSIKSLVIGQPDIVKEICYAAARPNHPLDKLTQPKALEWKHVIRDVLGDYHIKPFNPEEYAHE